MGFECHDRSESNPIYQIGYIRNKPKIRDWSGIGPKSDLFFVLLVSFASGTRRLAGGLRAWSGWIQASRQAFPWPASRQTLPSACQLTDIATNTRNLIWTNTSDQFMFFGFTIYLPDLVYWVGFGVVMAFETQLWIVDLIVFLLLLFFLLDLCQ